MNNEVIDREEFGDVVIMHIHMTSIDAESASKIEQACATMRPITVLDFAEVTFINSSGISALLKFVVLARESGYKLFAINVSPHHQKLFKIVEISRFMPPIQEQELSVYRQSKTNAQQ